MILPPFDEDVTHREGPFVQQVQDALRWSDHNIQRVVVTVSGVHVVVGPGRWNTGGGLYGRTGVHTTLTRLAHARERAECEELSRLLLPLGLCFDQHSGVKAPLIGADKVTTTVSFRRAARGQR